MRTIRLGGVALVTLAVLSLAGLGILPGTKAPSVIAPAHAETAVEQHAPASHGDVVEHDEEHGGGGHSNPIAPVLALLMIVMLAAKLGGAAMERLGQPSVLGELVFGVILGNLTLIGFQGWENLIALEVHFPAIGNLAGATIGAERIIELLGEIGVILLLFQVGLESNVKEMLSVGLSSLLVALLGVIAPFFLGWGVSAWLLPPGTEIWVHVFIGATLAATSVGITARVLKDLGRLQARESKIVLGAAVIDDVMGLVVLAVVVGMIGAVNSGEEMAIGGIFWIIGKAVLFLVAAVGIGQWASPKIFKLASKLRGEHMLLTVGLLVLFLFSWLADKIGLATIVGAFAAGLVLDELHFKQLGDKHEHNLEEILAPLAGFLVPIFFVRMGYKVDLSTFGDSSILIFAGALTLAAIVGKQVCSFGVIEKGLDKLSVGIGMIPRGEVGLIFAGIGASLMLHGEPVVNAPTFSAVVIMVIVTTLITPPALKWSLNRPRGYEGASDAEMKEVRDKKRQQRRDYYKDRGRQDGDRSRRSSGRGGRSRGGGGGRGGGRGGGSRSGGDRSGGDRSGGDRSGGERSGGERSGGDRSGGGRPGGGRPERADRNKESGQGESRAGSSSTRRRRRRRRPRRPGGGSGGGSTPSSDGT
jgi:Kef-type K+ transport system membrane component KefB